MKCNNPACGKEFEQPKRTSPRKYCCHRCYLIHTRKLVSSRTHPWYNGLAKT